MRRIVWALAIVVLSAAPVGASPDPGVATKAQLTRALGDVPPRAAIVFDPASGRTLAAHRPDARLPAASLLKMVTALIVSQHLSPEDTVTFSRGAALAPHDTLGWRAGATFSVDQVLHGMMMESSNGAARALAERITPSKSEFRALARAELSRLGASDTKISDPSGLDAPGQYSTVHDLALLARAVLADPWLASVVNTQKYELPWPDGTVATFRNLNHYFSRDPSAIGVKNGYTTSAGNSVAAAAQRDGRSLIVVALNSNKVYDVARSLMDLGFDLLPAPTAAQRVAGAKAESERALTAPTVAPSIAPQAVNPGVPVSTRTSPWKRYGVFAVFAYAARLFVRERRLREQRRRPRSAEALAPAVRTEPTAPIYREPWYPEPPVVIEEPDYAVVTGPARRRVRS